MLRWTRSWRRASGLAVLALIAAVPILRTATDLPENWPYISGWEYEWIADALSRGEGFSFRGDHRWLFQTDDPADATRPDEYYATAWEEPIYPLLLAACFRLLGEQGRVVMLAVHLLCFLATLGLVYQLGKRLAGPAVGLAAVAILLVMVRSLNHVYSYLHNSSVAAVLVVVCTLLTLWALRDVSVRRASALGGALGISVLTHAATMVFAPLAALLLLHGGGPKTARAWRAALALVFTVALVISPWALRNYLTFGEFVPVRTGFGFIADLTNPALARTFEPGPAAEAAVPVPWTASGPAEAWSTFQHDTAKLIQAFDYTIRTAKATNHRYTDSNEAARDKIHLHRTMSFIRADTTTAVKLLFIKALSFYGIPTYPDIGLSLRTVIMILAALGALIGFRNQGVQILTLFVLAYSAPYILGGPFYSRYSYPVEPLLAVLASVGGIGLSQWGLDQWRRRFATSAMTSSVGPGAAGRERPAA